jgi:Bacterial PH domain
MIYPAKCDWWIACLVVPAMMVPIGVWATIAYQTVTQAMPLIPGLIGTVLPLAVGGLLLWMFLDTSYAIGEAELVNRLGPLRFRVPLNAIEEVVATKGFRLIVGLGLAWSLDMLHLKYRKASGHRAWTVSISPQDKAEFLQELAAAVPGLKIVGNGLEE